MSVLKNNTMNVDIELYLNKRSEALLLDDVAAVQEANRKLAAEIASNAEVVKEASSAKRKIAQATKAKGIGSVVQI